MDWAPSPGWLVGLRMGQHITVTALLSSVWDDGGKAISEMKMRTQWGCLNWLQAPGSMWWVNFDNEQCITKAHRPCSACTRDEKEALAYTPRKPTPNPNPRIGHAISYSEGRQPTRHLGLSSERKETKSLRIRGVEVSHGHLYLMVH